MIVALRNGLGNVAPRPFIDTGDGVGVIVGTGVGVGVAVGWEVPEVVGMTDGVAVEVGVLVGVSVGVGVGVGFGEFWLVKYKPAKTPPIIIAITTIPMTILLIVFVFFPSISGI